MRRKTGSKTLTKLKNLGIDLNKIPEHILDCADEISTYVGFTSTLEIGFLLDDDPKLIRELYNQFPAIKICTGDPELFKLRDKEGDERVPFTHLESFWGEEVWYCMYSIPTLYVQEHLTKK